MWSKDLPHPHSGVVPFNTGRVLVGIDWCPARHPPPQMTADGELLQRALLAPPPRPFLRRLADAFLGR